MPNAIDWQILDADRAWPVRDVKRGMTCDLEKNVERLRPRGSSSGETPPADSVEARALNPWLIVALVSIGAFLGQFDASVVQLALPTLGKTFDASLETVSWVALAYLVSFASCLPIFGRLCDMFGRKSLYLIGYLLFVFASSLCGLASDIDWLILFRVLQGVGGSLLGANSIAILVSSVGKDQQGRALGKAKKKNE